MDLDHIGAFFAIFANRYLALALLSYLIITEYIFFVTSITGYLGHI